MSRSVTTHLPPPAHYREHKCHSSITSTLNVDGAKTKIGTATYFRGKEAGDCPYSKPTDPYRREDACECSAAAARESLASSTPPSEEREVIISM
jgi:hypothetical protein